MLAPPVPLRFLYLFPLFASLSWFLTLFILLTTWLAKGRPRYPLQSNPYVAFVSDIGAFTLKPLFCLGGILTALFYILTIFSVHYARYSPNIYNIEPPHQNTTPIQHSITNHYTDISPHSDTIQHPSINTNTNTNTNENANTNKEFNRIISILAIISSMASGTALVFLSILDTYRYHERHSVLLKVCFGGLGLSAVGTCWVYGDQTLKSSAFKKLRIYCLISTAIVFVEVCLGAAFMILLGNEYWRVAGILEWIVCFVGAGWLGCFVGFVRVPDEGIDVRERDPLLGDEAYVN